MAEKKVKITQMASSTGKHPKHQATLRALGLRKRGAQRVHTLVPAVKGMIDQVGYLLKIEDA